MVKLNAAFFHGIGLAGYVFKAMKTLGMLNDVELATGIATPVILLMVGLLTRKIRNSFK